MKGRSLRLDSSASSTSSTPVLARVRWARRSSTLAALRGLGLLALLAPAAACSDNDASKAEAAAPPSEVGAPDDPALLAQIAPNTTNTASTSPPVTTAPPTTLTESTPVSTIPPTVVETLPIPELPPPARADEPYIELGRIEIPKIGIDTTLLQGISLNTLDLGPGHWPGTALPGGIGNTVIAGHRTSHNKVFRNIDQLAPGDEVIFTTSEGEFVYVVRETIVVKPDAMYIIDQTREATATLFACHPPGSTRERIVVQLELSSGPRDQSL